jgi:ABC-type dipeptide/oligopeptide/nickel transport system permease component
LVSVLVFVILNVTGDPVLVYLGTEATPERVAELRTRLGLDRSLVVQYVRFLKGIVQGSFGQSLYYDRPAAQVVLSHVGPSAKLALAGLFFAALAGIVLGILTAVRRYTWSDYLLSGLSASALAIPSFWLGLMLIFFFAVNWRWFPTSGMDSIRHYFLPSITLAGLLTPQFVLLVRTSIIEVLQEMYVTTARSKGLSEVRVLVRHVLRNASPPIVAFLGLQVGTLVGGVVVTETVFAWPGLGRLTVNAVLQRDGPVVQAAVLFLTGAIILSNLAADLLNALLDPRIRYE